MDIHFKYLYERRTGISLIPAYFSRLLGFGLVPIVMIFFWLRFLVCHHYLVTSFHVFVVLLSFAIGIAFYKKAKKDLCQGYQASAGLVWILQDAVKKPQILNKVTAFIFCLGSLPKEGLSTSATSKWPVTVFYKFFPFLVWFFTLYFSLNWYTESKRYAVAGLLLFFFLMVTSIFLFILHFCIHRKKKVGFSFFSLVEFLAIRTPPLMVSVVMVWLLNVPFTVPLEESINNNKLLKPWLYADIKSTEFRKKPASWSEKALLKDAPADITEPPLSSESPYSVRQEYIIEERRAIAGTMSVNDRTYLDLSFGEAGNVFLVRTKIAYGCFEQTDFTQAELYASVFNGGNFRGSTFLNAITCDAAFQGADLTGAKFVKSDLRGVDLRKAILQDTSFAESDLSSADFRGVDMRGVIIEPSTKFQGADFRGADFRKMVLDGLNFENCKFGETDFRGASLEGTNFEGAILANAKFDRAGLEKLNLSPEQLSEIEIVK